MRREPWSQETKADVYDDENRLDQRNAERWVTTKVKAELEVRTSVLSAEY